MNSIELSTELKSILEDIVKKDIVQIVCPHCATTNRMSSARLGDGPHCGKCGNFMFGADPPELTPTSFEKNLNHNDIPLIVDFWAPWCGPCKMMAPAFVRASGLLEPNIRLAKLNTEVQQNIAHRYNIQSIPTLVLFRNGIELARSPGVMEAPAIVAWARSKL